MKKKNIYFSVYLLSCVLPRPQEKKKILEKHDVILRAGSIKTKHPVGKQLRWVGGKKKVSCSKCPLPQNSICQALTVGYSDLEAALPVQLLAEELPLAALTTKLCQHTD